MITTIGTVVVTLITALISPLILKLSDNTSTSEATNPSSTFVPDPTKIYIIRSVYSGKVLTVSTDSEEADTYVIQNDWNNGETRQQWRFEALDGADAGYYLILSVKSGGCLDVIHGTLGDGEKVMVYVCGETDNQKWRLVTSDSAAVILEVKHSRKVLDVADSDNGTPVTQYSYNGSEKQQWILVVEP